MLNQLTMRFSFRTLLIVPVLLQIAGTTAVVGYLSYRSGQRAVADLGYQLIEETSNRVVQNLDAYLTLPQFVTQVNAYAIAEGDVDEFDLTSLEHHFVHQLQILPDLGSVAIANRDREFLSVERPQPDALVIRRLDADSPDRSFYRYSADPSGENRVLEEVRQNFDPHRDPPENPWYSKARQSENGIWRLTVSLAQGENAPTLLLARFLPFYDGSGAFQGVLASGVYLTQMGTFLQSLNTGSHGQVLLIEKDGSLVATSTGEVPFNAQARTDHAENVAVRHRRLLMDQSQDALTRAVADHLRSQGPPEQITQPQSSILRFNQQRYFVTVTPLTGELDWLTVVVVPELDFMAAIQANLRRTAFLSGLTLLSSMGLGWWATRHLLNEHVLARQVTEKTAALRRSEANLKLAQRIAQVGSWDFDIETGAITWSEEMYRLFGWDARQPAPNYDQLLTLIPPEDRVPLQAAVEQAINEGTPYIIEHRILQTQGAIRHLVSRGEAIRNQAGQIVTLTGTATDITNRKQIEALQQQYVEELAEWRDRHDVAARVSGQILFEYDLQIDRDTWGPNTEEVLGYTIDQMPQGIDEYVALIHPEDRDRFREVLAKDSISTTPYRIEFRFRKQDGTYLWVEERGATRHDAAGRAVQVIGYIVDISERKQTELALRDSEARLRLITDSIPGCISYTDAQQRYRFVNKTYEAWFGRPIETVLGETLETVIGTEAYKTVQPYVERALAGEAVTYEAEVPYQGGETRYIAAVLVPEIGPHQQVQGYYALITDISERKRGEAERKRAEAALRQSEAKLQSLAAASPGVIYTVVEYPDGPVQYEYLSPAFEEIHEISVEQAYADASQVFQQMHPADCAAYRQAVAASLAAMQPFRHEWRIVTPSGKTKWLQANSRPTQREGGEIVWHGIVLDVTQQKQIELELQQAKEAAEAANQAKSTFIANISHELRSPLNAILGFARILRDEPALPEDQQENAKIIESSGEHLLNVINQVLDLSKLEAKHTHLTPTDVDLWSLLNDLQNLFALKADAKGLNFTIERGDNLPYAVRTDDMKLRQVLINLLDNAFKFTQQGSITLRVQCLPTATPNATLGLQFEVQDTGTGIAAEEQALLFQAFSQTWSGQTLRSGTGLGLVISREFVRLMGGDLTVASQLGQGSVFRFNIMAEVSHCAAPQSTEETDKIIGLQPGHPDYRLMIVDDSPVNRRLLRRVLSVLNWEIAEAENGEAALALWRTWRPHLIWMDLQMPVLDGYQATQQIRQWEAEPTADATSPEARTVIVAISASSLTLATQEMCQTGFDGFILKPFKSAEIFEKLQKFLGLRYQYVSQNGTLITASNPAPSLKTLPHLPAHLRHQLEQALTLGDVDLALAVIDRMQSCSPDLAAFLRTEIKAFNFFPILKNLRQTQ